MLLLLLLRLLLRAIAREQLRGYILFHVGNMGLFQQIESREGGGGNWQRMLAAERTERENWEETMGGCCATATTVLYLCVWCVLYPGRCHRPDTVPTPLHCPHSGSFPTLPPCRCCITRNSYYEALLSPSFFFLIHTLPHLFICSLPACKVAFSLFTSSVAVLSPTREILSFFQIN